MRYAIVASGGKQYIAREGETLEVDRLSKGIGEPVEIDEVLLAADGDQVLVGTPTVPGATVRGTIQREVRGEKIIVFRYQPKKRRRRKLGHRQSYSRVLVERIEAPGLTRSEAAAKEKKPAARRKAAPAAKPAARKTPARTSKSAAKKKG